MADFDQVRPLFLDHVGVAVRRGELEEQVEAYRRLGFVEVHREERPAPDLVREVLLRIGEGPGMIQLLEPLSEESPVARLIEKNGGRGGVAHVAYRVADIQAAYNSMKAGGFQLIDDAPRPGSRGTTIFFVHPKCLGYLIEIVAVGN